MALNLLKGAKDFERFHLQVGMPTFHITHFWIGRVTVWGNLTLPDGTAGSFKSWWWFGNALKWYYGTTKCDATRTSMYWNGQLDDGVEPRYVADANKYVMTSTFKERFSVRFFGTPDPASWQTMGGS